MTQAQKLRLKSALFFVFLSATNFANAQQATLLTREEILSALDLHNKARAEVGAPPLQWSEKLSEFAKEWANYLAEENCAFEHRPNNEYGENLFTGTAGYFTVANGVQAWIDEKKFYAGEPIGGANFSQIGHYTQLVWKGTTQVGGAKVICNGMMILVFNYNPPGNRIGEKPY